MNTNLDLSMLRNITPQESNLWELYFIDLPANLKNVANRFSGGLLNVLNSSVSLTMGISYYKYIVRSVSFNPLRNIDYSYDEASRKKYPTTVSGYDDLSVQFMEPEQFAAHDFLKTLMNRTYSNTTSSFVSSDPTLLGIITFFKKNAPIPFTSATGGISALRRDLAEKARVLSTGQIFLLKNMKYTGTSGYSLDYGSGEALTIDATFSIEEVESIGVGSLLSAVGTGTDLVSDLVQ